MMNRKIHATLTTGMLPSEVQCIEGFIPSINGLGYSFFFKFIYFSFKLKSVPEATDEVSAQCSVNKNTNQNWHFPPKATLKMSCPLGMNEAPLDVRRL